MTRATISKVDLTIVGVKCNSKEYLSKDQLMTFRSLPINNDSNNDPTSNLFTLHFPRILFIGSHNYYFILANNPHIIKLQIKLNL